MKIIDVYSPKGGVSKTTTASNLAGRFAQNGFRTVLVDLDEQMSCLTIFKDAKEKLGFDVMVDIPKKSAPYDVCIVDHHPSHKKKPNGDYVILPIRPSRPDYESLRHGFKLVAGMKYQILVTQVRPTDDDRMFVKHMRKKYNCTVMNQREIFKKVIAKGETVYQWKRGYNISKARNDINLIFDRIMADGVFK